MRCKAAYAPAALVELYARFAHRRRAARRHDARAASGARGSRAAATASRSAAASASSISRRSRSATACSSARRPTSRAASTAPTIIGDHVWIGPQAYLDARDLVLEDYVGWGPGAKVLGSAHTGDPGRRADRPHRSRDQAGADRRLGRHRHQRDDSAGRHDRPRRDRRRRRRRDRTTSRRSRSSPACRRDSCAGGRVRPSARCALSASSVEQQARAAGV